MSTLGHPVLYYDDAGITRLRQLYADHALDDLGVVPHDAIEVIVQHAQQLLGKGTYTYTCCPPGNTFTYQLSSAQPPPHTGDTFPYWTAMFQELDDSISTRLNLFTFVWILTGGIDYFSAARAIALKLADWESWTDPDYNCGGPACLDTAHAAMSVAYFYDHCFAALSADERNTIRNALVQKAGAPLAESVNARMTACVPKACIPHNIDALFIAGLGITALALLGTAPTVSEDPNAPSWHRLALSAAKWWLDAQGSEASGGGPFEGPFYGGYATTYLSRFLGTLPVDTSDLPQHPVISSISRYAVAMTAPGGREVIGFGDTSSALDLYTSFVATCHYLTRFGDGLARWHLRDVGVLATWDPFTVAWYTPNVAVTSPSALVATFGDIGHAIARDGFTPDALMVGFKTGPLVEKIGHNHKDLHTIVLFRREWLLADGGYGPRDPAAIETARHNSLLVDGEGQSEVMGGKLLQAIASPAVHFFEGEAASAYPSGLLDSFQREVVLVRPRDVLVQPGYVLVHDRILSPQDHIYTLLFGDESHGRPVAAPDGATIVASRGQLLVRAFAPYPLTYEVASATGEPGVEQLRVSTTVPSGDLNAITLLYPLARVAELPDPSFELCAALPPGDPECAKAWTSRFPTEVCSKPGVTHCFDTTVSRTGRASGRISLLGPSEDPGGYFYSPRFPTAPGSVVSAEAWIKSAVSSGPGARVRLVFWSGDTYVDSATWGPYLSGTCNWQRQGVTGVAPIPADTVQLALEFSGFGQVWFDDAAITVPPLGEAAPPTTSVPTKDAICIHTTSSLDCAAFPTDSPVARFHTPWGNTFSMEGKMGLAGKSPVDASTTRAFLLEGHELQLHAVVRIQAHGPGTATASVLVVGDLLEADVPSWQGANRVHFHVFAPLVTSVCYHDASGPFRKQGGWVDFSIDRVHGLIDHP